MHEYAGLTGLWGASDLLLVFKFLREFRTDQYMMIPYLWRQVKVQFGVKKWFLPCSVPPAVNISIMKAKHINSNRWNSLENSAESESVIRLMLNAVFEEIVFSRRNFFSVIFSVKINPNAHFKHKTYGTRRYIGKHALYRCHFCFVVRQIKWNS